MDTKPEDARSRNMAAVHSKDTEPERHVRSSLFAKGYRYRKNYAAIPGCPDIYLQRRKVAIFVHGCFWHWHAGCKHSRVPKSNTAYWLAKFGSNRRRDRKARRTLMENGIRVIVIWECTVRRMMADPEFHDAVIEQIETFISCSGQRFLEL